MRQSVSAIFCFEDQIFSIIRQNHLSVFPGYVAFPGGKVDRADREGAELIAGQLGVNYPAHLMKALVREMREELSIDLIALAQAGKIKKISYLGLAVTPEFNPYRFENYYYKIELSEKSPLQAATDEAASSCWSKCAELLRQYRNCELLAVPPMVKILTVLGENARFEGEIDLDLKYGPTLEVPMIESIYGVKQFLPLSHTFPPANRTNCFLIGDESSQTLLIDPSPKDSKELKKLQYSLRPYRVDRILITHHHPDHHEQVALLAKELGVDLCMSQDTKDRIRAKYGGDYFGDLKIHILKEGDVVTQSRGQDVIVFEVPGHDEGQIALAPRDLHWFLAGDLIQTVGTVVIGHPEGDMKKYFETLKRVIALKPRFIIPSHGISIGGTHKLEMTLKHREFREEQILELALAGASNEEILNKVYEGLEPALSKYALKTIDAHLRKLALEGKCSYPNALN